MRSPRPLSIFVLMLVSTGVWAQSASTAPSAPQFANLPLSFEQNVGQTSAEAQFIAHGKGYTLFLSSTEAVFEFQTVSYPLADIGAEKKLGKRFLVERAMKSTITTEVVRMKLLGANATAQLNGVDVLAGTVNYLVGSDPGKWRTGVPLFAKVRSSEAFPGIAQW